MAQDRSFVDEESTIITNTFIGESNIKGSFRTEQSSLSATTKSGYEVKLTADHKVFTVNRASVKPVSLLKKIIF